MINCQNTVPANDVVERLRDCFDNMVVYKDLKKNNLISIFRLPSFMRDFVAKKFQDEDGVMDEGAAVDFIREYIPSSEDWKGIIDRIVNGETVKILAKVVAETEISTGERHFALPDYGLGMKETIIPLNVWNAYSDDLLKADENWGIVELSYQFPQEGGKGKSAKGRIQLNSYRDFCPYSVDLEEYKEARAEFTLDEWIDVVLAAADYNPKGYKDRAEKFFAIRRFLPFAEQRINLLELAPPGTGKSYFFGQVNRYGCLASGKINRAKLIYDLGKHHEGLISGHDFVALDEVREAEYLKDKETQSALQVIMEAGKYTASDGHVVVAEAGIVFLGNIISDHMDRYQNMMVELPTPFQQTQFLDRIHGFIEGWELPRMNDDMKMEGWALNSEYFASIMHELRNDPTYRSVVDKLLVLPPESDTRDTEAIKRLASAFLKLLFPNVQSPDDITPQDFKNYCLDPAMDMRSIIRMQMGIVDSSLASKAMPAFTVEGL